MAVEWIMVPLTVVAVLVFAIVYPLRQRQKLVRKLRTGYGNPPQKPEGRLTGELYSKAWHAAEPGQPHVDDLTWADLDMDTLFFRLNNCQSAAGDAWLYSALRRPMQEAATLQQRHKLATFFGQNEAVRTKVQQELAGLGRRDAGLDTLVFHPGALALHRRWLYLLCAFAPLLGVPLLFVHPAVGLLWLLGTLVGNIVFFSVSKGRNDSSFGMVRYVAAAVASAGRLAGLLRATRPELAGALTGATAAFRAVTRSNLVLMFDHRVAEVGLFDPLAFFQIPMLSYGKAARNLHKNSAALQELVRLLGEVDMACALASWRESLPLWCTPTFGEEVLEAENLYHPLLDEPVPNNATLAQDLLLTGSNASGKSTYIKAVAVNCLLAQTLYTCTAERFTLRGGLVATSMAVADSVVDGDSYFIAEIKSMRRLMRLAEGEVFCYFFIDEILKGTNTIERVAASAAVLQSLHSAHCACVAATHDTELTRILGGMYANAHFRETVTDDSVLFDYKLHAGPATSRNAILLLARMDFPPAVTATARTLVAHFETQGEWDVLPEAEA